MPDRGDVRRRRARRRTVTAEPCLLNDTDAQRHLSKPSSPAPTARQRIERFAFNVAPEEGDLKKLDGPQLAGELDGVRYEFHEASDINYNPQQLAGFNLSESLL